MSESTNNTTQEAAEEKKEVKKPRQQQGKVFRPVGHDETDASERAEMKITPS